jgi:O-antigen ligase
MLILFFFSFYIVLAGARVGILTMILIWGFFFFRIIPAIGLIRVSIIAGLLTFFMFFTAVQSRYVKNKVIDSLHNIGLFHEIETEKHSKKYHKFKLRATLWEVALNTAKKSMLFGHGQGSEEQLITEKIRTEINPRQKAINSHNQFLSTMVNTGLLGLALLLLWVLYPVGLSLKTKNYPQLAIIIILFASMLTESFLCRQKGVFIYTILISLIQIKTSIKERSI